MTSLQTIEHSTGPSPVASVIVLHGLGASGHDFEPLVQELDLSPVGAVRYVFPHAPNRPVTINGGYVMPAWYDLHAPDPRGQRLEDEAGLRASQAAVGQLIAAEVARGIPPERIVLAGFSQGCALTLMTGLRHPAQLAGLVGLSGYLPLAASTAAERSPANAATPVFLAHGSHDEVIAPSRAEASRDALLALGQPVEWKLYPMAHSVCAAEIADLNRWLLRVLA